MRFSIIIPTFNEALVVAKTLRQYVEAKKNYQLELIVADGGSNDGTLEIARQYADKIAYKTATQPETIAFGRNRGAALATGQILIFFDADVLVSDLNRLLEAVSKTFSDYGFVAATTKSAVYPEEQILSDRIFHPIFWSYVRLLNFIGIGASKGECQIIRRSAFEQLHGYNGRLGASEDFELFGRLRKLGKIKCFSIPVYESPRRYRKIGYLRLTWQWSVNFLRAIFGLPIKKWSTIR